MSDVRTFKAASMQEALTLVREEMGSEAVILQTRQIPGRKSLLPWSRTQETYEITAGLGIETKTPAALQNKNRSSRAGSALRHRASNLPQENRQRETVSQPLTAHQEAPAARRETAPRRESAYSHPSEQPRFRQRFAEAAPREVTPSQKHFDPTEEFTEKLNAIQEMLESLDRRTRSHRSSDVPSELFHIYTDLIEAEVDESIAHDLITRLKEHASHEQLKDSAASKSLLAALIESQLVCSQPIRPVPGQRKVVALVGPTGVGKTTTIAKLAANFRLRDNIKMGLVTVDTYRIAAVEQLRTYAEIIDLPMQVVSTPKEMQQALDEMVGLDLVLIDTAGRSPSDDLKIQELERLFREVPIDEVSLVMSMTSSVKTLEAIAQRFQVARPTSMILTKLDEAPVMGSLLTLSQNVKLPVRYLTTGQDVPDDIEPANAARMARLILGEDQPR
ncbi:flagellar biosynthesis protein FlhF [Gimesia sp.]|uniref:flagellar biosynthesis protein FlhF n=1 Tax=Gimesia sp. TaxID=2024833 RepID=UPI000C37CE52|nr:flagellar biosynthesis protein FlhF [Gimesia sp.]MAX35142.1 flagellar biosynthesis protein FlhF [Gimesia sp.]HBL44840.1 flagellar biosynthesis protein FlhF [Planctomycetaceae bacterium]|tara:strand:- start:14155 stop:15495 length:1341 start_codon:yes stop_codon:yes gene_type:complete